MTIGQELAQTANRAVAGIKDLKARWDKMYPCIANAASKPKNAAPYFCHDCGEPIDEPEWELTLAGVCDPSNGPEKDEFNPMCPVCGQGLQEL